MDNYCFLKDLLQCCLYSKMKKILEKNNDERKKLSENDTQLIFVEPLLWLACYDIFDPNKVKRSNRNSKDKAPFDIMVFKEENLLIPFEVKSLESSEFPKINNSGGKKEIAKDKKYKLKNNKKYKKIPKNNMESKGTGDLIIYPQKYKNKNIKGWYFDNFHNDGVGQLFSYTFNYLIENKYISLTVDKNSTPPVREISKLNKDTEIPAIYPVLTNGKYFIFFKITKELIDSLPSKLCNNSSNTNISKQCQTIPDKLNSTDNNSSESISTSVQVDSSSEEKTNYSLKEVFTLSNIKYKIYSNKDEFDNLKNALIRPEDIDFNCNSIDIQIWLLVNNDILNPQQSTSQNLQNP